MDSDTPMPATVAALPPVAAKIPHTRSFHGREFHDDYEWLREKENPAVREYLEAENAFTDARTAHLKPLEDAIFGEVKERIRETDMSLPVRAGRYWYFSRTEEGKSYGISSRIPVDDATPWTPPEIVPGEPAPDEEVILDSNELAEGHEFFSLGAASVTLDGRYLAYSVDLAGDERYDLRIKDLAAGELLDDEIPGISSGATWVGDDYLFYQRVDAAWRPHEVWRHHIGSPVSEDVCIFREEDEHYWVGVGVTRSERFLLVSAASKTTSESWYLDLGADGENADGELTCIRPREQGVQYDVDHAVVGGEDHWLVLHDSLDKRPNGELGRCPVGPILDLDALTVMVEHRDDRRVEGVDVFADHIVLATRDDAIEKLSLMMLGGSDSEDATGWGTFEPITFDEELYSAGSTGNAEWESPVLRVSYTSYVTPGQVWEIDLASGERTLRKQQEVLGDVDLSLYTASRRWVTATDGADIPVSLIHRTDVPLDRVNPVLLYGYGSYEACMDPYFSVFRLSMLDRGVVYAVAHVRGGGEMGRAWYEQGKELHKKTTFTDFIDVADNLIAAGMTTRERMVAEGGSAGGLLMGAVANMAPDRFVGIEAVVPFVDPLTSILMPELPLTVTEWEEWGDPYHDAGVYDYMATYAPYENVTAQKYPSILAVSGFNDTRVLYVEPSKWVAKLRETALPESGEILLKTDMTSGHGGVSGRYAKWHQTSFEIAWELDLMGATERL
ncbi:S9 family peptidase [Corynebacterium variabile]|uniref:S9 family peptidase n=1 Tax=Corynebacterium variabile TaxID=1727 RepID=UPI0028B0D46C|nr:S9 family peptidase [Corynebacterium variabile]